jgi:hypothetical protein
MECIGIHHIKDSIEALIRIAGKTSREIFITNLLGVSVRKLCHLIKYTKNQ